MSDYKYRRVLLKLSGEALMGDSEYGIDTKVLDKLAAEIKPAYDGGVQIAVVVGGGNIFRGLAGAAGVPETTAAETTVEETTAAETTAAETKAPPATTGNPGNPTKGGGTVNTGDVNGTGAYGWLLLAAAAGVLAMSAAVKRRRG